MRAHEFEFCHALGVLPPCSAVTAAVGGAVPLMPARRSRGNKSTGALIMSMTI